MFSNEITAENCQILATNLVPQFFYHMPFAVKALLGTLNASKNFQIL